MNLKIYLRYIFVCIFATHVNCMFSPQFSERLNSSKVMLGETWCNSLTKSIEKSGQDTTPFADIVTLDRVVELLPQEGAQALEIIQSKFDITDYSRRYSTLNSFRKDGQLLEGIESIKNSLNALYKSQIAQQTALADKIKAAKDESNKELPSLLPAFASGWLGTVAAINGFSRSSLFFYGLCAYTIRNHIVEVPAVSDIDYQIGTIVDKHGVKRDELFLPDISQAHNFITSREVFAPKVCDEVTQELDAIAQKLETTKKRYEFGVVVGGCLAQVFHNTLSEICASRIPSISTILNVARSSFRGFLGAYSYLPIYKVVQQYPTVIGSSCVGAVVLKQLYQAYSRSKAFAAYSTSIEAKIKQS